MQIRKPTRMPSTSQSVVIPGRVLAAWEDEVTARYDVQELKRDATLLARASQQATRAGASHGAASGVTPIDVVEVTFDPSGELGVQAPGPAQSLPVRDPTRITTVPAPAAQSQSHVPLYVLKALLTCYTDFMGVAAKTVLKQEMIKLGVTPQTVDRAVLPTLVGRLAARLDTRAASDGFLRAVRLVDPALCTF